jgi:hypothetical protein
VVVDLEAMAIQRVLAFLASDVLHDDILWFGRPLVGLGLSADMSALGSVIERAECSNIPRVRRLRWCTSIFVVVQRGSDIMLGLLFGFDRTRFDKGAGSSTRSVLDCCGSHDSWLS